MTGKRLFWTSALVAVMGLVVISDADAGCCRSRCRTRCFGFNRGCGNNGCGNYGLNNGCATGGCATGGCSTGGCSAGGCSAGGCSAGVYNNNNGYNGYNGTVMTNGAQIDNTAPMAAPAPVYNNQPINNNQSIQANGQPLQQNTYYQVGKPVVAQPQNSPTNNPSPDVDNSINNLTTSPIQGTNPAKAPAPAASAVAPPQQ